MFYLNGEKLSAIRSEKKRNYVIYCDECMKEIKPNEKCTYFEFAPKMKNCGGGSFASCDKCVSSFTKDVTVD